MNFFFKLLFLLRFILDPLKTKGKKKREKENQKSKFYCDLENNVYICVIAHKRTKLKSQ